jgi:predicted RNA-binding Zn-ribbon protein involved in translation (DUF1610 family)
MKLKSEHGQAVLDVVLHCRKEDGKPVRTTLWHWIGNQFSWILHISWYGCQVLLTNRFYPSTKRCSACGEIREISLQERQYHCPVCGLTMERDLNAAVNLEQLFVNQTTASSTGSNACGEHIRWRLDAAMLGEAGTEHQSAMNRFE